MDGEVRPSPLVEGRTTVARLVVPLNALPLMEVTDAGMVMDIIAVDWNASVPISFTEYTVPLIAKVEGITMSPERDVPAVVPVIITSVVVPGFIV